MYNLNAVMHLWMGCLYGEGGIGVAFNTENIHSPYPIPSDGQRLYVLPSMMFLGMMTREAVKEALAIYALILFVFTSLSATSVVVCV